MHWNKTKHFSKVIWMVTNSDEFKLKFPKLSQVTNRQWIRSSFLKALWRLYINWIDPLWWSNHSQEKFKIVFVGKTYVQFFKVHSSCFFLNSILICNWILEILAGLPSDFYWFLSYVWFGNLQYNSIESIDFVGKTQNS